MTNSMPYSIEHVARTLWEREGGHCVSSLVSTLASNAGLQSNSKDLEGLVEQASELCYPSIDWESAAREAISGWDLPDVIEELTARGFSFKGDDLPSLRSTLANVVCNDNYDASEFCEANDIDPNQIEVFEHWIVSDWLADRLAEQGEKVDKDFAGLTIWARTTTGQAVYADSVIENIAKALYATT